MCLPKGQPVFRLVSIVFFALMATRGQAACTGVDLLAQMEAPDRVALYAQANAQPNARGLLWRAERGGDVVHVMGTLHTADPRHKDNMAILAPLIARADTILLEMGDGDEKRLQAKMAREPGLAFIIDGPTLPELLDPTEWDQLRAAMADRGVPGFMAAKMQPWMAMLTLGMSACVVKETSEGKRGLDQMIIEHANVIGNPAQALEDYDTSMYLFTHYDAAEVLDMLRLTLALEKIDPDAQYSTLVEAYFREDVRVIWEFGILQSLASPQGLSEAEILAEYARLEDTVMTQRNLAWMDRIYAASATGEVFVGAGALHLPGTFGILNLLDQAGFSLTRVPLQ
jgi:hypothetical protein